MTATQFNDLTFQLIVESAPNAIILVGQNGNIAYANTQAEKSFGYQKGELLGQSVERLIPDRFSENHLNFREAFFKQPAERAMGAGRELFAKRKDNSEFPIEIGLKPFDAVHEKFVVASIIDISERKKSEARLAASEMRFRETLDNMLEGAQIINHDWQYVYINDALEKQGKIPRQELIGATMMEKYPGIESTELFKYLERCMYNREPQSRVSEFEFPDGSKGWFELRIQPINEGIFILSMDITERKRTELEIVHMNEELERKVQERTAELEKNIQQLRDSEEKFYKAFHASSAGMTITKISDSRFIEVNHAFEEMVGFRKKEILGHTSVELGIVVNLEDRDRVWKRIRENGSAHNFEMTIRHRSGKIHDVLGSAETILMNGEKYSLNIIYDITERKQAEQQLSLVNKELEAFSYSISHDLRAPLRAIHGYTQMLSEDFEHLLDEEGKRILSNVRYNASKMGQLIDDLLAFSRLGRKEPQKTLIDLNDMIEGVLIDLNKSVSHRAQFDIGELHSVEADYSLLHQVLFNLISNAVKYSSKKENPLVRIQSEDKDGEIVVTIADNGAGFNMKYMDKLFGVFQRLHSNEEFEGTGVGLAIVQRILAKHNGRIWATAEPNKGANFYFALPKL